MILLGETKRFYADGQSVHHNPLFPGNPEVWTCNAGFRIWQHDLLFVMDDLLLEEYRWPQYGEDLKNHDRPILTSEAYDIHWPMALNYPFMEICDHLGLAGQDIYFFNTVPYMLAYALFIGVQKVTIFGADYYHPNQPGMREQHLANTEWWLGFCRAQGMTIELSPNTTLMNANNPGQGLYGYRFDPRIELQRSRQRRLMEAAEEAHQNEIAERIEDEASNERNVSDLRVHLS